jgi:hypothetical protein
MMYEPFMVMAATKRSTLSSGHPSQAQYPRSLHAAQAVNFAVRDPIAPEFDRRLQRDQLDNGMSCALA